MGGVTSKKVSRGKQESVRLLAQNRDQFPIYVLDPQTLVSLLNNNDGTYNTHFSKSQDYCLRCQQTNQDYSPSSPSDTHHKDTETEEIYEVTDTPSQTVTEGTVVREDLANEDHYDCIGKYSRKKIIEHTKSNEENDSKENTSNNSNEEPSLNSTEQRGTTENDKRCKTYEYLVNVFKKLIVKNVIVHDLLPHLRFIEDEGKILAVEQQRSPQEAVLLLLEEMAKSKEVMKWKLFITALEKSGYEYIVQNIRGTQTIDNTYQVYYLRTLKDKLSQMIMPRELLPRLCAEEIITDNTRQEIEQEETNRGRISAALMLLDRIPRKGAFWYPKFVQILREENINEAADMLEIPEIMNCTSQSFSQVLTKSSSDHFNSCSEQEQIYEIPDSLISNGERLHGSSDTVLLTCLNTINTDIKSNGLSSDPDVTGSVKQQPESIARNVNDEIKSFTRLNKTLETNNNINHQLDEQDINETYESSLENTDLPLTQSMPHDDSDPPTVTCILEVKGQICQTNQQSAISDEATMKSQSAQFYSVNTDTKTNIVSDVPVETRTVALQPDNILQVKTNQGHQPKATGPRRDSDLEDEDITIDVPSKYETNASTINIPINNSVQQVLRSEPVEHVTSKPELRSVEVQVDIAYSSPGLLEREEGYLEPSLVANFSGKNQTVHGHCSVQTNTSDAASIDTYEEAQKGIDSSTVKSQDEEILKDYQDEERDDIENIMIDIEKLRRDNELIRRKYLITKERTELLRSKCELQKELESTKVEYQALLQSEQNRNEGVLADDDDDCLNQLYNSKTNNTNLLESEPVWKIGLSSRHVRRRQSIYDWRQTFAGFTDRLFQPELDFLNGVMVHVPSDTVKLYDFSTSKTTDKLTTYSSDVDSAVFSDLSAK